MAIYEYFCPTCRERFEERRPMSQASVDTVCRVGHRAERTISMFATGGGAATATMEMPSAGGGGCCGGGGCACGR